MKHDIQNRTDLILLVDTFYEKVKRDETIGFFFNEIAAVDWGRHLPVMYDFWESTLFGSGTYSGNPMNKHIVLSRRHKMEPHHFQHWIALFHGTVDELFSGTNAETIKQRAAGIATVMQIKIKNSIITSP